MPYVSKAQERWGHTPEGEKALGGPAKVKEWDAATKGKSLPEKVQSYANGGLVVNKSYMGKSEDYAKGGSVLGEDSKFLKTKDRFRSDGGKDRDPTPEPTEDVWGKGESKANPKPKDKSLKPVKPRS